MKRPTIPAALLCAKVSPWAAAYHGVTGFGGERQGAEGKEKYRVLLCASHIF